jgi:ATP-dependent DNA ligase
MDEGRTDQLVFFAFDLLFLNGESTAQLPLIERKERLQRLFKKEIGGLRYSEHVASNGPQFREQACKLAWKASSLSGLIGPTHHATGGSGSSRSVSTARSL